MGPWAGQKEDVEAGCLFAKKDCTSRATVAKPEIEFCHVPRLEAPPEDFGDG